ncbi:MAG: thiopurine S-methyltransferase [Gammaproteobacteria bacterium]
MDPDFWHERWQANQIGFHQHETNEFLERYWHALGLGGGRILVPLCGKSLDMLWLQHQGHAVAGIEISPLAVEAFFRESGLHPVRTEGTGHSRWSADAIDVYCGDFFALNTDDIGAIDGFYDRAALVALPASQRTAYVEHLVKLLPLKTRGLLVTLDYHQPEMDGPPFAVSPGEVDRLFAADFSVEPIHKANVLDANPAFRERGLGRLTEQVFKLVRT